MKIKVLPQEFSVCKVKDFSEVNLNREFFFTAKTDDENSVVCPTEFVPENTTDRSDGWRAFRIIGMLDFSLIGILAKIANILAKNNIGLFAVSTYNTDYILTKSENFGRAVALLEEAGYRQVD